MAIVERVSQEDSGIYVIININNNDIYLGSSNNLRVRKYNHYYKLRHNLHHSIVLQRAWNKYGENSFRFKILLLCEPFELLRYEQLLLDFLCPKYNIAIDAKAPTRGTKLSEEHKQKIGLANKGHPNYLIRHTDETKAKISLSSIGRKKTEEQRKAISIRMKNNKNGVGNKSNLGKTRSLESRNKVSKALEKHYGKVLSPTGEIFDITNLVKFCKQHSLTKSSMHYLFSGKMKQHRGWKLWQS